MDLSYYPGCTLKTRALNFEDSAIAAMAVLGVNLIELPRWNCCGTVYSMTDDDLAHHIAPVRNLVRIAEQGSDRVVTLCSFCYNTLKRADLLMRNSPEKRNTINTFMDDEIDYDGQVEVVHLLEVLRDDVGWEAVARKVKTSLEGLKVAPYYGCTLTRPQEIAIDSVESPTVLQGLMQAVGTTVLDFPLATECCGSFEIVSDPDAVIERAYTILGMAQRKGADAIVVSCPLCAHNLGHKQAEIAGKYSDFTGMPIVYFTQLLALAVGVNPEVCRFDLNFGGVEALLRDRGLIPQRV
ncbi:MAG: CoB--CoM heterodisulfide reductase iron-sulfur subunit B family protein [Dehalococcoidales bacterium]|nr:MAG: CoB--CoM heterodisulfide reductase iron-sulfur subunit B family protein [Dehalococcoidales bacterium]